MRDFPDSTETVTFSAQSATAPTRVGRHYVGGQVLEKYVFTGALRQQTVVQLKSGVSGAPGRYGQPQEQPSPTSSKPPGWRRSHGYSEQFIFGEQSHLQPLSRK